MCDKVRDFISHATGSFQLLFLLCVISAPVSPRGF